MSGGKFGRKTRESCLMTYKRITRQRPRYVCKNRASNATRSRRVKLNAFFSNLDADQNVVATTTS